MKKQLLVLGFTCMFLGKASAQNFTKVTSGDIVTEKTSSWSSAWGDFNNDGLPDLFVGNAGSNSLFKNNGDGTFTKITTGAIVTETKTTRGCAWGDYNNDGNIDLIISAQGGTKDLFINNGNGTFTKAPSNIGTIVTDDKSHMGLAWGDLDNDSYIDVVSTTYVSSPDQVYFNKGDGTFSSLFSQPIGTETSNASGVTLSDYDNDGDLDVLITNEGRNLFYKNNGNRTFTKVSGDPFANDATEGRGSSWGDYDNDGDMDLFTSTRSYRKNNLYQNNGDGTFTKITSGEIVNDNADAEGCVWVDLNNDGWLDMFVSSYTGNANLLYMNNGDRTFNKVTTGDIISSSNATGTSWADYDKDGDLDAFITTLNTNYLLTNNTSGNNYLAIKCVGVKSNKSAIGAKVRIKITSNGKTFWQMREITSQNAGSYGGQNSIEAHFGLGNATTIDSIRIEWPSGIKWDTANVAINQYLTISERNTTTTGLAEINSLQAKVSIYPNPVKELKKITIKADSKINSLELYNILGERVSTITQVAELINLDLSGYPAGIYLLKGNTLNGNFTKKLIIE